MKTPSDKFKWIQAALALLIFAILIFLALTPVAHASVPGAPDVQTQPTFNLENHREEL